MNRRDAVVPPLWALMVWAVALGQLAYGGAAVSSWALFGDWQPLLHVVTIAVLVVLSVAAGLAANRSLAWLLRGWRR